MLAMIWAKDLVGKEKAEVQVENEGEEALTRDRDWLIWRVSHRAGHRGFARRRTCTPSWCVQK